MKNDNIVSIYIYIYIYICYEIITRFTNIHLFCYSGFNHKNIQLFMPSDKNNFH